MARKIIATVENADNTTFETAAAETPMTWDEATRSITRRVTVAAPKAWNGASVDLTVRISFEDTDIKQLCMWAMASRVIALQAALRKHDISFVQALAKKGVYSVSAADAGIVTDPDAATNALTKAFAGLSAEQQAALLAQLTAAAKK